MDLPRGLYLRDGVFYVSYRDEDGKRKRVSVGKDFATALARYRELRGATPESPLPGVLFDDLIFPYLERQKTYTKPKSYRVTESSLRILLRYFKGREVGKLTGKDLQTFIEGRRKTVRDKSINKDLATLRGMLNYSVEAGIVERLPVKVRLLPVPKRRIKRILTKQEIARVLEHAKGRIYGILRVACETGFRTDEILHLRWADVHWQEGMLAVTAKDGIWSPKNHQERSVFVSPGFLDWLAQYRSTVTFAGDRDWIFSTRNRTPITLYNACRAVRKVFEAAGVYEKGTPTIHLIRHTVASTLLANGVDLETVRQWLGHSDIAVTSVYLHSSQEQQKRAQARLSEALGCAA